MAMRRNLWPQALDEFKKAFEGNPEEPEHHALLAWAMWASVTEKTAALTADVKKRLQTAIELGPKCVPAFYYLAMISNQIGESDRAYSLFRKALEIMPGHVDAQRELRVLEMRRQKGTEKPKSPLGGIFGSKKK
jgi:Tfp pilus assembly protein PilF